MNPKLIRGRILAILAAAYPTPVTDERIRTTLDDLTIGQEVEQVRGHVTFLEERDYVSYEADWNEVLGDFWRVRIEGKGLALVRGDVPGDDWVDSRGYEAVAKMSHLRKRAG